MTTHNNVFDVNEISKSINKPFESWKGNCYYISCLIVKSGLVEGKAVFGKYYGYIDNGSMFAGSIFTNHGWIETPEGQIIDPTRWVFENKEPYIFETNKNNKDYDRGSNIMKEIFVSSVPEFNSSGRVIEINNNEIEGILASFLGDKKEDNVVCVGQAMFVGSQSLKLLGDNAKPLFTWFKDNSLEVFIPLDNFELVMVG